MTHHRILIIGGTGVFGKRLARHLATFEGIELHISSRDVAKATQFADILKSSNPQLVADGIGLDHRKNLVHQLEAIKPFAVIDCSGPFQTANYDAARAIIGSGAHLIDLADARDYLAGFTSALKDIAQDHGVSALTGASSTPTLSACVVDHVTQGWARVDTIDISITPGGKSEVGRSVIEAILSYAGKDIPSWQNGQLTHVTGWTNPVVIDIPQLGRRRIAPVETYDAEYLGPVHNVQSRVSFSAGLESRVEQWGIGALANLRKRNLIPRSVLLIPLLLRARRITRIPTSDRGGMLVQVTGLNADGQFIQAKWSLVAKNDDGPFIPILPAAAELRCLLEGNGSAGASIAHKQITLADILMQMETYDITTAIDANVVQESLFETALGVQDYQNLPTAVQQFHRQTAPAIWSGKADIEGGKGIVAKAIAQLFGLPVSGKDVDVTVGIDRTVTAAGMPSEQWNRRFADKPMTSVLRKGTDGTFTEHFAPFTFLLGLDRRADGIAMPVTGWMLGRLSLPRFLAPRSDTMEYQDKQGRFCFDVRLTLPVFGLLARYRGWLVPSSN